MRPNLQPASPNLPSDQLLHLQTRLPGFLPEEHNSNTANPEGAAAAPAMMNAASHVVHSLTTYEANRYLGNNTAYYPSLEGCAQDMLAILGDSPGWRGIMVHGLPGGYAGEGTIMYILNRPATPDNPIRSSYVYQQDRGGREVWAQTWSDSRVNGAVTMNAMSATKVRDSTQRTEVGPASEQDLAQLMGNLHQTELGADRDITRANSVAAELKRVSGWSRFWDKVLGNPPRRPVLSDV